MPFQDQALSSLRSLSSISNAAQSVPGRRRQQDLLDEMKRNLYLESQRPNLTVSGATPVDVERAQADLEESPDFGNEAVARLKDYEGSIYGAQKAGFESPQAAAAYGRGMEEEKIRMPARQAGITGEYDRLRQTEADRAKLQLQREDPQGRYFEQIGNVLSGGGLGGRAITHVSPSGISFAAPQKPPTDPAISNALLSARRAYQANPSTGLQAQIETLEKQLGIAPGTPTQNLSVDQELSGLEADPELVGYANDIVGDPRTKNLAWDELQSWLDSSLTPPQREQLKDALMRIRGF